LGLLPVRYLRWSLPGLCLALVLLAGCRADSESWKDAALSSQDVPAEWTPADLSQTQGQELWDTLPDLLSANSEAQLLLRAFESESGLEGAATILVMVDEPAALTVTADEDKTLAPLGRLLDRQDALLSPQVRAGDPGAYFASSDVPRPGSLRSRLVRLLDDDYLFSDSAIFTVGPVLAVVTVWYPEKEGPFRSVDDLAAEVDTRLRSYLDER